VPAALQLAGGQAVTIPLRLEVAGAVESIELDVVFDPAILSLTAFSAQLSCAFDANVVSPGVLRIAGACDTPVSGPTVIANLLFQTAPSCGVSTQINLERCSLEEGAVACSTLSGRGDVQC
jgi:hypothetical protein